MAMPRLGDVSIGVSSDLTGLDRGLKQASQMLVGFAQSVPRYTGSALQGVLNVAGGNLLADGAKSLAGVLPNLVKQSVQLAGSWETSATAFEVLMGSAEKARDLMGDLRRFAAESPLTLSDAVEEGRKLLAAGVSQNQIVPTLGVLSDLAGGDREKFSRVALAFSQVRSAGRLQGDELRQLQELGVNFNDPLAKVTGIPKEGLKDAISQGKVLFTDLQRAIRDMTSEGGQFYRMTEKGAMTTAGLFAKLEDGIEEVKRAFGRAVIEESGLNEALRDGAGFADQMRGFVDDLRPGIRVLADTDKAGAQVFGEFLRNAPAFAAAFAAAFREAAPNAARLLGKVNDLVRAAQNFKLDPEKTIDMAFDAASAFGAAFDSVIGDIGDGFEAIYEKKVKPIAEAIEAAGGMWKAIADPVKRANREIEDLGFSEAQFERRAKDDPLVTAAAERLARIGHTFKGLDPASVEAVRERERYRALNRAYHDALTRQREYDLLNQRVLLHEHGKKSFGGTPEPINEGRKERDKAAEAARAARFDLEKAVFPGGGPVGRLLTSFEAAREKAKEAYRSGPRGGADPLAAVLGGNAAVRTLVPPREPFRVDPVAAAGRREAALAPAAEAGSAAVAEAYSKLIGGVGGESAVVAEVRKLTEVQQEALGELRRANENKPGVIALPPR